MAVFSLREAAEQAGTSKSTIFRAIKAGRLSAARTEDGGFAIEASELFRVYPPKAATVAAEQAGQHAAGQDTTASETPFVAPVAADVAAKLAAIEAEVRGLRELLAEVRTNRDELRADRDEWKGKAERLLTDQRKPWFRRMFA